VLDIDDTEDRVHGGQQLSLFHAHYDSRCFLQPGQRAPTETRPRHCQAPTTRAAGATVIPIPRTEAFGARE
jgi:Transposase DDE domain group 1